MDVCVAGAGIGGLALARGLIADGHQVRVFERGSGPATGGAAVTIFSNGAAAAAALGVGLDGLGGDILELAIRRNTGQALLRTDLRPMRKSTGFAIRTIPRADLIGRLDEGLGPDVVRYGARVAAIHPDGQGVTVELADGATLRADVVVGADGYRSTVRESTLADGSPVDVGWVTWQGLGPVVADIASGTAGQLIVGPSGLVGLMPAGNGLTQWWFDMPTSMAAGDGGDVDPLASLREGFAAYAGPVPGLLAAIHSTDVGAFPHVLRDPASPWGRGPTTLLGDAAHAFPPSQAQGANQALEDAWLLRRVLAHPSPKSDDLPEKLRRYERKRSARVRLVSRMAASERTNRPPGAALGLVARATPAAVAGHGYLRLIRRISSVLHDEKP